MQGERQASRFQLLENDYPAQRARKRRREPAWPGAGCSWSRRPTWCWPACVTV